MLIKILIQISPVTRPTPDTAYLNPLEVQKRVALIQYFRRDRKMDTDKEKLKTYRVALRVAKDVS